jgi:hypothetical protein
MVAEVQSDGSLLALNASQWASVQKLLGGKVEVQNLRTKLGGSSIPLYSVESNLRRQNQPPTPAPAATPAK